MVPWSRWPQMRDLAAKAKWQARRFDEMAVMVSDRVDDPSVAGVDRYVGLEHLDAESLSIRRWGSPDDVEATKLRFRAGDIIFGRRRAYQRKLGVADFEGICSAHAMVLRAKAAVALPEFLPLFMQSDYFMERAAEISVGSLSPTINWKTLANEEFVLPPVAEQRRLTAVILAAQQTRDALRRATAAGEVLLGAAATALLQQEFLDGAFGGNVARAPAGWSIVTFGDVCERITYGFTNPMPTTTDGPWMVTGTDVRDGQIDYATARHTSQAAFDADLTDKSRTRIGDVLLTKDGTLGRVALVDRTGVCVNQSVAVLRPSAAVLPAFLAWVLRAPLMQRRLMRDVGGSAVKHIYITKVAQTRFTLPPLAVQGQIVHTLQTTEAALGAIRDRAAVCAEIAQSVLRAAIQGNK